MEKAVKETGKKKVHSFNVSASDYDTMIKALGDPAGLPRLGFPWAADSGLDAHGHLSFRIRVRTAWRREGISSLPPWPATGR